MTIKAIVFDLGGVVIELDFSKFFKDVIEISSLQKPNSYLMLEFWRQSDIYHQGKMTNEEFYYHTCELIQECDLKQNDFFNSFNSVIDHINQDILELIRKIRYMNKYKLLALSNVNSSHWDYILNHKWGFIEFFDEIILSHEIKITKPDPKVFEYTIEKAGCKPVEIVFIDDGLNNVRAASKLGIYAIHYMNLEDLIEEFKKLKIILI